MIQSKEIEAIVAFLNAYGGRRGTLRVDLYDVKYADYDRGLDYDLVIPEDVLRKLYASILISNELAKQLECERAVQADLWRENLDSPLWQKYADSVADARAIDTKTEAGNEICDAVEDAAKESE